MPRDLHNDLDAALAADRKAVRFLADLDYADTPTRAWTGLGNITWDGKTFVGVGNMAGMSEASERVRPQAGELQLTLNGVPLEQRLLAAAPQLYRGRRGTIYMALMTLDNPSTFIGEPFPWYAGLMDVMVTRETADTATIAVTIVDDLIDLKRPRVLYFTSEDQKRIDPNDTFLDHMPDGSTPLTW